MSSKLWKWGKKKVYNSDGSLAGFELLPVTPKQSSAQPKPLKYSDGTPVRKPRISLAKSSLRAAKKRLTLEQWREAVLQAHPDAGWIHTTKTMLRKGGYMTTWSCTGSPFWACVGPPVMEVVGFWCAETDWRIT